MLYYYYITKKRHQRSSFFFVGFIFWFLNSAAMQTTGTNFRKRKVGFRLRDCQHHPQNIIVQFSVSLDVLTNPMIENEVDSKIRRVIGQSLPLKSKRLSLNRLKCFHEAAQSLLDEAMDEPAAQKKLMSSFSTDAYTKNKLSRVIFL